MFFKKGLETQQTHCRATRQILIESLVSNGTDTDAHQNCTAYCTPGPSSSSSYLLTVLQDHHICLFMLDKLCL